MILRIARVFAVTALAAGCASGARGFSRGLIFKQDGTLVASVAQEGLIRDRSA